MFWLDRKIYFLFLSCVDEHCMEDMLMKMILVWVGPSVIYYFFVVYFNLLVIYLPNCLVPYFINYEILL